MLRRSWLIAILVLGMLLLPSTSSAQNPPLISVDITAGYDNAYRSGDWFPIVVTVTNSGQDISPAILEWSFTNQNNRDVFRQTIDLPRGSSKQVSFAAITQGFARNGQLRVIDAKNQKVLLEQVVSLRHNDDYQFMLGLLSSDSGLLGRLQNQAIGGNDPRSITTIALDPASFPNDASLLFGLDTIVVHDLNMSEWSQEQRNALRDWVEQGGQLVVSGGAAASHNILGLEELLPAQIGALQPNTPLASLSQFSQRPDIDPPSATTSNQVSLAERATALTSDRLVVERRVGMGDVIFVAFDVAALQGWEAEIDFWLNLLSYNQPFLRPFRNTQLSMSDVDRAISLPELELPGFFPLFCFISLYIFVIGPLNYLILRKIRRPNLAWITIPAITFLFAAGTYGYGILLRGTKPIVFQISVLQGVEGGENAYVQSAVGLFSPQRRQFDLAFPSQSLVRAEYYFDFSETKFTLDWDESATRIDDVLVDVSSISSYRIEKFLPSVAQVRSDVRIDNLEYDTDAIIDGVIRGEVTNTSSITLKDSMVVAGDSSCLLGDLAPGQTQSIDCSLKQHNFPYQTNAGDTDTFDRAEIIRNVFGRNWSAVNINQLTREGISDPTSAFLIAWVDEPTLDIQINGSTANQAATSLYVIRLNGQ